MPSDQSLPIAFGPETAKWICVGAIDITQISVAGWSGPWWWLSNGSEPVLLDHHRPYDRKRCNRYRDDKRLRWDFQCESKECVGEGGDDMGLGNCTKPLSAGGAQGDPDDKFIVSYWEFCRKWSPMRIGRSVLDLFQEP
ncbi:Transferase of alkyl or aryl groups, partial [Sarracenia purpurea var. burkii]